MALSQRTCKLTVAEMAALYRDEKYSLREIGEKAGVTMQRVHQLLAGQVVFRPIRSARIRSRR